jgi:hypothetical protein
MHYGFVHILNHLLRPVLVPEELIKTRDIAAALLKKGFEERSSPHKIFYLCIDGKISGVHTFLKSRDERVQLRFCSQR